MPGATAAIVGHSERRQIFGEGDELVNKRVKGALKFDLQVILCVGETLEERESGATFSVLERQIRKGLDRCQRQADGKDCYRLRAGLGNRHRQDCLNEQAQEAHAFIRGLVEIF